MPAAPNGSPALAKSVQTVIRDVHGLEVLRIGTAQVTLRLPTGEMQHNSVSDAITLVDGTTWHAGLLFAKPPVELAVCNSCRNPPWALFGRCQPTHGLFRLSRAKTCVRCGLIVCPKHHRFCVDGRYRCPKCSRLFKVQESLLSLFFSRR